MADFTETDKIEEQQSSVGDLASTRQEQEPVVEDNKPVSNINMDNLAERLAQYTPILSMKTRRVLYVIASILLIIELVVSNIQKRGVSIPAVVMGCVDSIPQIVTIIVLIIAYTSNKSVGTVK